MGRDGHLGMGMGMSEIRECRGLEKEVGVRPQGYRNLLPRPQITSLQQEGEELSGQARCPFDATQSTVAIFAGVHLGM